MTTAAVAATEETYIPSPLDQEVRHERRGEGDGA
jgi:hypothetical protein